MSKGLKKLALVVGIAALAVTGIGLIVAPGALGALAGVSAAANAIGLSTLASIGIAGVSIGTMPKTPKSIDETGANARGHAFVDPNAMGVYAFGESTVPCALVYEQHFGTGANQSITNVFAHCWHRIEAYVSLAVNSETVTFSGNAAQGDWLGLLTWQRAIGTQSTALSLTGTDWPITAIGEGVAYSSMKWDFTADSEKLKGGVPTRLDLVVKGAWLYDPRLDPAYGTGTQDFGTPSTWSYPTTNPGNAVLVLLRYLIGEHTDGGDLIWGRGASETEINLDNFATMASVADETLDSGFRFSLAGIHTLDGNWEEFVRRWEDETGGKVYKPGGVYHVWLPHDDLTALTTITKDDLLVDTIGHSVGNMQSLYNTARGRYIEPTEGYRGFPYPEVSESTAVTEDNSKKRVLHQDFSWVQERSLAERIARIKVRRSRFSRVWTVAMGWKGFGTNYEPFTVHNLNIAETGDVARLVRVIDRKMSLLTGAVVLTLQEEDASIYDDTVALGTAFTSGTISGRIDHASTVAPRYIDGTHIDDLKPAEIGATAGATAAQIADITQALSDAAAAQATADGKIATFIQDSAPTAEGVGDFWIDSNDNNKLYRWDGDSWNSVQDGDIAQAITDAAGAQATADGKVTTFVGTSTPTAEGTGDLWVNPTTRQLKRWDGDSWEVATPASVEDSADVTANHAANAVDNPEFEAGDVSWTIFAAWAIVESALNARRGSWAAQATSASADGLFNDQRLQVAAGDRVLAQGFAKRTSGTGSCSVLIRWYDSAGSSISDSSSNSVTSSSYAIMRVVGIAPANAVTAQFIFVGNSSFNGYADGAYMSIIGRESDAVYRQSTAPSHAEGRIWIDTDDLRVYRSTGTAWVQIATDDALLAGQNAPAEGGADVTGDNFSASDFGATQSFFPSSWTGFSTSPTGSLDYAISEDGRMAVIWVNSSVTGTSGGASGTGLQLHGLPASIQPANPRTSIITAFNNGVAVLARATVQSSSIIFSVAEVSGVLINFDSAGWNSVGTKGLVQGTSFLYFL